MLCFLLLCNIVAKYFSYICTHNLDNTIKKASVAYMMRNKCYIAFMALAVAVMLTVTFLPHHHHNGMLCTEVEYCEDDGRYNDEHTGHSADHTHCIDDSDFIVAKRSISMDDYGMQLLPLFIIAEHLILYLDQYQDNSHSKYFYRQSFYKSADVCPTNVLRGPPYLFV